MSDDDDDAVTIVRKVTEDTGFHAWAKRVVEEEQTQKVRLTTFPIEGLPVTKGDSIPLLEIHLDGKTFILTNVTCIRGLEQGLVKIEGDVDSITEEVIELVEVKPREPRSSLDSFEFAGDFKFERLKED